MLQAESSVLGKNKIVHRRYDPP